MIPVSRRPRVREQMRVVSLLAALASACGGNGAEPRPMSADRSPVTASEVVDTAAQFRNAGAGAAELPPARAGAPGAVRPTDSTYSRAFAAAFARVIDTLRATTRVPLRVPRLAWGDASDDSVRITVLAATPEQYDLVIGDNSVAYCTGGVYCRLGEITGERVRPNIALPAGRRVALPGGRTGVFTPATCGANCSDSQITWDEGPYRYVVGLKVGKFPEVLRMAESVVSVR